MYRVYRAMYVVLAGTLLVVSGSIAHQYAKADAAVTAPYYASLPSVSLDELFQRRAELFKMAHSSDDPKTYYAVVLPGLRAVARSAQAMILRLPHRDAERMRFEHLYTSTTGLGGVITSAHTTYTQRFGGRRMAELAPSYQEALDKDESSCPHEPAGAYWQRWYLVSLMLAVAFFAFRLREKGLTLWVEALQPQQFLLAVVGWPVFMWKYPMHTPATQMRWALRYATLVLGTLLSGGAGVAKAETAKDGSKRDRKGSHSLQIDLRAADTIGGPSAPEGFLRLTAVHDSGFFLESVNVVKPGFKLTSDTIGHRIVSGKFGVVNGVAGVVLTDTGGKSMQASAQIFGGTKHWGLVIPSLGVERQWAPAWLTTWVSTAQVFGKPNDRLRIGIEGSVRKSSGVKPTWSVGALVGWSFGKGKPAVEGLILHNSAGAERARVRMTNAYAF